MRCAPPAYVGRDPCKGHMQGGQEGTGVQGVGSRDPCKGHMQGGQEGRGVQGVGFRDPCTRVQGLGQVRVRPLLIMH